MSRIKSRAIHLIAFSLLVAYLFSANAIYTTFFVKNGKPVLGGVVLPPETESLSCQFRPPEQVYYEGQYLYELRGYALHESLPPDAYNIMLVLRSASEDLLFEADSAVTRDLLTMCPGQSRGITCTEFRVLFSKNVLRIGEYQMGILLQDSTGTPIAYQMTRDCVERTASAVRFVPLSKDF